MFNPNYCLLYVDDPAASGAFYAKILGRTPIEASPTFVLFVLESGLRLGLWSRQTVLPATLVRGGGGELAMPVTDSQQLESLYAQWRNFGVAILQEPTAMDFGQTFVGLDPDGHRLRVFVPTS